MKKILFLTLFSLLSVYPLCAQRVGLVLSGGGAKGAAHIGIVFSPALLHVVDDVMLFGGHDVH